MKAEILQILQMQKIGKLTQEQAAELLAVLADRAREQDTPTGDPTSHSSGGASGPQSTATGRGDAGGGEFRQGGSGGGAAAALHDFVDTAIGVGATVGRAATVWGSELIQMVHRDQGGNNVTLSKVADPAGVDFTFRANTINVSKVAHLTLNHSELSHNSVNASQLSHLTLTHARLTQCQISGSSVSHVTLEGVDPPASTTTNLAQDGDSIAPPSALRNITFNGTKFHRVRLTAGSQMSATTFQAASVKDLDLSSGSTLQNSRIADSVFNTVRLEAAALTNFTLERSNIQSLTIKGAALANCTISSVKASDTTITGGSWTNVRFRRDPVGSGVGGVDNTLAETRFENCTLSNVEFSGCVFRRASFRNLNLANLSIRHVDFTGMNIDSEAAFKAAAGLST